MPFTPTTREQRVAIKRTYDRGPLYNVERADGRRMPSGNPSFPGEKPLTYREFREMAMPSFGCDDAVILPWCNIFLCIERDGYVHS